MVFILDSKMRANGFMSEYKVDDTFFDTFAEDYQIKKVAPTVLTVIKNGIEYFVIRDERKIKQHKVIEVKKQRLLWRLKNGRP